MKKADLQESRKKIGLMVLVVSSGASAALTGRMKDEG